jgi:hypothetical protein
MADLRCERLSSDTADGEFLHARALRTGARVQDCAHSPSRVKLFAAPVLNGIEFRFRRAQRQGGDHVAAWEKPRGSEYELSEQPFDYTNTHQGTSRWATWRAQELGSSRARETKAHASPAVAGSAGDPALLETRVA